MNWNDKGIIISKKKYGESSLILKVFTQNHGVYSGFVKGGLRKSKKGSNNKYEIGNIVHCEWTARLEDSLGSFKIEVLESLSTSFVFDRKKLLLLNLLTSLINGVLHDREAHNDIFEAILLYLHELKDADFSNESEFLNFILFYVLIEFLVLGELGYQLVLNECAVTGSKEELLYVSPKTGRAVCKEIGEPYKDKVLKLPEFIHVLNSVDFRGFNELLSSNFALKNLKKLDLIDGLVLTGHFVIKWLFYNKYMLDSFKHIRGELINLLECGNQEIDLIVQ